MSETELLSRPAIVRRRIEVRGIVQGVGLPAVRLPARVGTGARWLGAQRPAGVTIEVQGDARECAALARRVRDDAPTLARVDSVAVAECPLVGGGAGFAILESGGGRAATAIGPDSAICDDCLAELFDPANRRYRYAFINCTNCGPRYTITRRLPYDRAYDEHGGFRAVPGLLLPNTVAAGSPLPRRAERLCRLRSAARVPGCRGHAGRGRRSGRSCGRASRARRDRRDQGPRRLSPGLRRAQRPGSRRGCASARRARKSRSP